MGGKECILSTHIVPMVVNWSTQIPLHQRSIQGNLVLNYIPKLDNFQYTIHFYSGSAGYTYSPVE